MQADVNVPRRGRRRTFIVERALIRQGPRSSDGREAPVLSRPATSTASAGSIARLSAPPAIDAAGYVTTDVMVSTLNLVNTTDTMVDRTVRQVDHTNKIVESTNSL